MNYEQVNHKGTQPKMKWRKEKRTSQIKVGGEEINE